ncbi:MAG: glutamyl-tRNA reductase [Dehalococcoidia bacterium]
MITYAGLSHRTAPLAIREQLTVPEESTVPLLQAAHARFGRGAALLTTCNRLELYVGGEHEDGAIHGFLMEQLDTDRATVERYIRTHRHLDAVRHLYTVASGVDSMVLGETEVLGQVRSAFSTTVNAGTDDIVISRLFHTALRTGRRARTETAISERALSVSSIAAQQARAIFPGLTDASVLVIGAGEAGRLAAQAIVAQGAHDVVVTNRTAARADGLATELGGRAEPFEALPRALAAAHIVISAVGADEPVVPLSMLRAAMAQREGEPLLVIDIGLPRDFEPGTAEVPGVQYFDLDDLSAVADENAAARQAEVNAVQMIVHEEAQKFATWASTLQVQPTIAEIAARAETIRQGEVAKTLRRLRGNDDERERFEALAETLTRAVVKQLLADPIHVLRERGDLNFTLEAARTLFRLDPHETLSPDGSDLESDPQE